jgi:hypothetical protein
MPRLEIKTTSGAEIRLKNLHEFVTLKIPFSVEIKVELLQAT